MLTTNIRQSSVWSGKKNITFYKFKKLNLTKKSTELIIHCYESVSIRRLIGTACDAGEHQVLVQDAGEISPGGGKDVWRGWKWFRF